MIHTHHHDSDSTLDGVGSASHCARVAASLGQPALAQTNHGNINGALKHRKACAEYGLIPIVGSEVYWRPNRKVQGQAEWQHLRWHLILLATNLKGWHNLIRLTSEAFASGFYRDPCIDWELQERHPEGLICTTSCVSGPLAYLIKNGTDQQIHDWVKRSLKIYGDNLFFSIMPHDFDGQRQHNLAVVSLANQYGCPLLHEKDSHYPEKGWMDTQKVAILAGWNRTFEQAEEANQKRIAAGDEIYELWHPDLHISSEEEDREMYATYHPDLPADVVDEAICNTDELLCRIDPILPDKSLKMPRSSKGIDARDLVIQWCYEGLTRVGKRHDPVYEQQLKYEIEVIDGQRAWPYFLLVADVVRWARSDEPLPKTLEDPFPEKKRPIRLNSGRGSAAGSLVCFLTKITMIDPIAHKFKFERFMNPERKSMPDVDLDIASTQRNKLKEYVARKYGRDAVADIMAQQHFQPRIALQLVTRTIYGFDHPAFKSIAVLIHDETGVIDPVHDTDLEAIRAREPDLDAWAQQWPDAWEHARRLENEGDPSVLRLSKHASGVAILPGIVTDVMPTIRKDDQEVGVRTAWAETTKISVSDEIGVVKVDFLGLKGMDQQQMVTDAIFERTGEEIDLDALPVLRDPYAVDKDVLKGFCDAITLGVNQMQNDGMREFTRRVQPENAIDLAAINALYRPGPLGSGGHNRYVKRKHGLEPVEIHEILQPVIGDTYGSLAFQEQVMGLFEVLVGYTAGQADDIRKIIGKLYRDKGGLAAEKLAERREEFIAAAAKILGQQGAESLWLEVEPYCGYCLSGDTEVIGAAGRRSTLRDLAWAWLSDTPFGRKLRSRGVTLLSMGADGRIRPARADRVWSNGERPVYEITTRAGRKIKATGNHRLLTIDGYCTPVEIFPGDRLVVTGDKAFGLTKEDAVISVEPAGVEEVFDVSMDSTEHNFLANGIVSHNSFNRSHSGSYMIQAIQDMYLKVRYPLEFYSALLTLEEKKTSLILREAQVFKVAVLPPDVNISGDGFTADYNVKAIRFGLRGIKNIGEAVGNQLLADQPYASLEDFMERSSRKYSKVNKKARETLLKAGALDSFGARADGNLAWRNEETGEDVYWDARLRAQCELDLFGVALEPGGVLGEDASLVRENIFTEQEVIAAGEGAEVIVGGSVSDIKKMRIRRGRQAGKEGARFKMTLDLDRWSLLSWPDTWDRLQPMIETGEMLMVRGKVNERGEITVSDAMPLEEFIDSVRAEQMGVAA